MPRSVLASELLARTRQATDTENNTHLSDAEIYLKLTAAIASTWEHIIKHGLGSHGVKWAEFTTVANQGEYDLTASIWRINGAAATALTDFGWVKTLYVQDTSSAPRRPINRVNPNETYGMRTPLTAVTMRLYYVQQPPVFSLGSETFDGISGWEEHAIQGAAVAIRAKREEDTGPHRAAIRELEERMKSMANRSRDAAPRIVRRQRAAQRQERILPYTSSVTGWDLRGGNIELFLDYGFYI